MAVFHPQTMKFLVEGWRKAWFNPTSMMSRPPITIGHKCFQQIKVREITSFSLWFLENAPPKKEKNKSIRSEKSTAWETGIGERRMAWPGRRVCSRICFYLWLNWIRPYCLTLIKSYVPTAWRNSKTKVAQMVISWSSVLIVILVSFGIIQKYLFLHSSMVWQQRKNLSSNVFSRNGGAISFLLQIPKVFWSGAKQWLNWRLNKDWN